MLSCRTAISAVVVFLGAPAPGYATEILSLDDALARVVESHPDFAALDYSAAALSADLDRAAQAPALNLGANAENALGSGAASALNGVELTLSLASVLERGDKRAARVAMAERRVEGVSLLREGKRLDLLAEVARRYLDALSARSRAQLTEADLRQRERIVEAAGHRVRAGSTPRSVWMAAEAERLRTAAALQGEQRRERHARRRLAMLWGDADADFALLAADLSSLPEIPDYRDLVVRLAQTPELRRFAHESRLREARLQLARSAQDSDIQWQVGVRRLQASGDWGLVGGVSIPLGSSRRADPEIRAADAELAALEFEREGESLALQATLAEVWSQFDLAVATAAGIDSEWLPALLAAAQAAEESYRAGASGYLEWAQLQSDISAAQRERLEASLTAHRALIELQRLTGESFRVPANISSESGS